MNLAGRKILVTGAGGFIGSHLTEQLVREGHDVRALIKYSSSDSWGWLDAAPEDVRREMDVVAGDVRDPHAMLDLVAGCEVVFHLAALIAIPFSYRSPAAYVQTNISGTLNLLQAARAAQVERFVQTSTSETYGTAQYVPIDEQHPISAQSPYAASKAGADQLALSFQRTFGLPVSVIRPFNTYGPRQSTRAVIPTIITQLAAGLPLRLGALSPTRDLTFVEDTAAAFIALAASDEAVGQVVNVGSDLEISIGDLASLIGEVMGQPNVEVERDEQRLRPAESEVERLWASNAKMFDLTGWRPKRIGLDGLRSNLATTAEWFQEPDNLARYRSGSYTI